MSKDAKNSMTSSQLLPLSPAASQIWAGGSCASPTGQQLSEMLSKKELLTGSTPRHNCDFLAACARFKISLGLPNSYFEKVGNGHKNNE